MVEQRAVAVLGRVEAPEVVRELLRVVGVHADQLLHLLLVAAVVRQRVVGVRDVDLRIRPVARLVRHHEGDDPGQVGLPGQHLQVEHQPGVLAEGAGNAGRLLHRHRQVGQSLPLGHPDPALDVADGLGVLVELGPVARAERPAQPRQLVGHGVQDGAVLLHPRQPRRGVGGAAAPEQPLEDHPRVVLHRQRGRLAQPVQRVGVDATVAGVAGPERLLGVERQLEGGELRLLLQHPRRDLVHRDAGPDVGAGGLLRMHAGQERPGRAGVVAGPLAGQRVAVLVGEAAQHGQAVAVRRQRLHHRLDVEGGAGRLGRPLLHDDAVRHVDHAEPLDRRGGGQPLRRERRDHAVEQRQRERRADAAQERPPGQMRLGDDHCSRAFLI